MRCVCHSNNVIKYGLYKGTQNYLCKSCGRRFASTDHIPKMQYSRKVITNALNMYYDGKSFTEMQHELNQQNNISLSRGSVYNWVECFTEMVADEAKKYHPKVGNIWVVDEDYIRIDKRKPRYARFKEDNWVVFWDVIDTDTRFLLASQVVNTKGTETTMTRDAEALVEKASKYARKYPRLIVTQKLKVYLDAIELAFVNNISHRRKLCEVKKDDNLMEIFHGLFGERTDKARRDLKNEDALIKYMDRWLLHYNYFRQQESLKGQTPARAAGISFPYQNWKDVIEQFDLIANTQ